MRKLPEHIPGTIKQWRVKKRGEWNKVIEAVTTFRMGCVYTPMYRSYDQFMTALDKIKEDLRGDWNP